MFLNSTQASPQLISMTEHYNTSFTSKRNQMGQKVLKPVSEDFHMFCIKVNYEYNMQNIIHRFDDHKSMQNEKRNGIPARALLMMMLPMEWPTKLSLISLQPPYRANLSARLRMKATTSSASRAPISLKSPEVFSSFDSDIRQSAPGSSCSHWFLTSRRSRWWPCISISHRLL